ncbi:cytochrome d ubiquinol oxidase subunit II [Luteimonas dalianensis]|uniref:cytochrome d ubiquinol oxidase subunit II n=1 Tax=Luteimonas dalianensis TaxID=1148196 RepID=UPI003BEF52DB
MDFDIALVWALILLFAVFAYVVMDGFDLGIGILFPGIDPGEQRDTAINTVAPVWDGNETWLVLGGGGLMAAFPLAFGIIMTAVYPLVIAMVLALVFRGVAFEARWRDPLHRRWWDAAFQGGSTVAALAQGIILGALVQGIAVDGREYAGGWWDWLTPFSLLTGVSVVVGYALLGATWLVLKTEGELQARARRHASRLGVAMLAGIVAVSLATLGLDYDYHHRWTTMPAVLVTAQVPLLTAVMGYAFWRSLRRGRELAPFLLTLALFALTFVGLGISVFPWVVPQAVTIADAASPDSSLVFMLVGAVVLIPVILLYTGWSYWVFRGKVGDEGYH